MGGMLGYLLILFFTPLLYVLWQQKSAMRKRVAELGRKQMEAQVEVERLGAALKKEKARSEDLARKLIALAKARRPSSGK